MSYKPYGGLTQPLMPDQYYYVPDSQIVAPPEYAFEHIVGPLFLGQPNVMEIEQGSIGDCYLLAALLAIVDIPRGQQFVNRMMVDLHNGRVLIRLFHHATLKPIFFELDKTILKFQEGFSLFESKKNRHKAPWVYLIEKAYAVYRLKFGGKCFQPTRWGSYYRQRRRYLRKEKIGDKREPGNQVEALTSGHCDDAFKILLGRAADRNRIPQDAIQKGSAAYDLFKIISSDPIPEQLFETLDYDLQLFYRNVFSFAAAEAEVGQDSNIPIMAAINDFRQNINIVGTSAIEGLRLFSPDQTIRQQKIKDFMTHYFPGIKPSTRFALLRYIAENIPTKRGDGMYIPRQEETYDLIRNALKAHKLVCLGSNTDIGRSDRDLPSRRESQVKGLAGPHGYQVLNVYRRGQIYFLLLRNPWHRYTREYQERQRMYEFRVHHQQPGAGYVQYAPTLVNQHPQRILQAQAAANRPFEPIRRRAAFTEIAKPMDIRALDVLRKSNNGVFELALEDLTKRFLNVYICDPNPWVW